MPLSCSMNLIYGLLLYIFSGPIGKTYYKDTAGSCSDYSSDSHLCQGDSPVAWYIQANQQLDSPPLGYCVHDYSFHSPEEENKELVEEVWVVRDQTGTNLSV